MIEAEKANYPITRICALLEVSRSEFYKWRATRSRGPTPTEQRRTELDAKVATFHKASDGVYGAPRILADLRDDGQTVSRKTVAASLRRQGLAAISPRTFAPVTTIVDLDARFPKTWSNVDSMSVSWTESGPRTSPICALVRAGCICARSVMATAGG